MNKIVSYCPYPILDCETGEPIFGRKVADVEYKYEGENASKVKSIGKRTLVYFSN